MLERPSTTRAQRVLRRCIAVLTVLAALTTVALPASAAERIRIGAVGDVAGLSRSIGAPLAKHSYAHFDQKVPDGRMISVKARSTWAETAKAAPGSAQYADIVRWADTIKSRPGPIMFAFNHEPEAAGNLSKGTPQDFIRAWRRVVDIFRQRGVRNVEYTLQMTAWAYRAAPSDRRHISKWYPGDAYVDNVGADAYNWYTCGHGNGRWMELKALADPLVAFARSRGKKASLPEFASFTDTRRAQWIRNAHQYLVANRGTITAAFYFQQNPTNPSNQDCRWKLSTSAEYKAYGEMAKNSTYFTP